MSEFQEERTDPFFAVERSKMDSQSQRPQESALRRVGIGHAFFHRPTPPIRCVTPLPQRQSPVLMPDHKPVSIGRFVKQRSVVRVRLATQNFPRDLQKG